MAKATLVHAGESVNYTPGSAVAVGDVIVQNSLVGIAQNAIPANTLGALAVQGVFKVQKANEQINAGAAVYWDEDGNPYGGTAGTGCVTTTSSGNTFMGYAEATAGATATTVNVRLFGVSVSATIHNPISAVIADPGNAGAIPVTNGGNVSLVTTGAETRTLAAPSFVGQELSLALKTDGGDCVITCATGLNQAGNTTATFNDAGDFLRLTAIYVGANLRWRVDSNDGVTLA